MIENLQFFDYPVGPKGLLLLGVPFCALHPHLQRQITEACVSLSTCTGPISTAGKTDACLLPFLASRLLVFHFSWQFWAKSISCVLYHPWVEASTVGPWCWGHVQLAGLFFWLLLVHIPGLITLFSILQMFSNSKFYFDKFHNYRKAYKVTKQTSPSITLNSSWCFSFFPFLCSPQSHSHPFSEQLLLDSVCISSSIFILIQR